MATTIRAPRTACANALSCHRVRPVTRAPARAIIAPPSGATTMAPMIAATESSIRPKVAMSDGQREQHHERDDRSAELLALGKQVVERGRAERLPGIDQDVLGRVGGSLTVLRRHAPSARGRLPPNSSAGRAAHSPEISVDRPERRGVDWHSNGESANNLTAAGDTAHGTTPRCGRMRRTRRHGHDALDDLHTGHTRQPASRVRVNTSQAIRRPVRGRQRRIARWPPPLRRSSSRWAIASSSSPLRVRR